MASRWSPGAFEAARQKRFLRGSGLPIQIATVELIEIGAGGGSIAQPSALGTLHVGPESAGAQPGPACYGRGGTQPTVTDADLALGYLNAEFLLGGYHAASMPMRRDRRLAGRRGGAAGSSDARVAFGVHDVVNENMAGAARVAIAERGRVPREYALLATGGAGAGACLACRPQARRAPSRSARRAPGPAAPSAC